MTVSTNNCPVSCRPNHLFATLSSVLLTAVISSHLAAEPQSLQLGIHQVSSWHASNDSQLTITDHQNNQYQALLEPPCDGLEKAKAIAFTSNDSNTLNQASAVILPNGKRCPFKSFSREITVND